jgi:tRNA threonylcarbamoyladenosine biosynthesis protein TsaE
LPTSFPLSKTSEGFALSVVLEEEKLVAWGEAVGAEASPPLTIALRGDLGAGKTTLARAIARGAGVQGPIPSPTYNLLFRYPGARGVEIVHLDLYRLASPDEVWALGWQELPAAREIVLIEWPERAEELLPQVRWDISLSDTADAGTRKVELRPIGEPGAIVLPVTAG